MGCLALIGNVIWFICGGEVLALIWLLFAALFAVTIVGLPIARAFLEFAKLSAFPFGKKVIRDTELKGSENVSTFFKVVHLILNIIWFPFGLILTIIYLVAGIVSIISIVGIPVGIVYLRMGKFLLFPIGARVVSKDYEYAPAPVKQNAPQQTAPTEIASTVESGVNSVYPEGYSPKKWKTTLLLSIFLGVYGAHLFYVKKIKLAIGRLVLTLIINFAVFAGVFFSSDNFLLKLFLSGCIFAWWIIDLVNICRGKFTDNEGYPLLK